MYALWIDGHSIRWDEKYRKYHAGMRYPKDNIIEMQLDLASNDKTLKFVIWTRLGEKRAIALNNIAIDESITYCMAVCCNWKDDQIRLISYHEVI